MSGINGYAGAIFSDITRGNTIPFTFTMKDSDGVAIDVTGWKVYISVSSTKDSAAPELEVEIPVTDALNGVLSGSVSDSETLTLAAGNAFIMASYVDAAGQSFIIDMAKVKVHETVNPRVDQT